MFANMDHSLALHQLGERAKNTVLFNNEHNLPFSVVAPFDNSHSLLSNVDPYVIDTSSKSELSTCYLMLVDFIMHLHGYVLAIINQLLVQPISRFNRK